LAIALKSNSAPGLSSGGAIWLDVMVSVATNCSALGKTQNRGILCARGGYGSARILEDWTWPQVEPPKLIGFSDITALLWSLSRIGVSGVHGSVLTTLAAEPDWSIQRLFDWAEGRSLAPLKGTGWGGGISPGILHQSHRCHPSTRHPVQPHLDGVILALEDVTEAPYRIDRLLTQWRLWCVVKSQGIALGRFSHVIRHKHSQRRLRKC